MEDQKENKLPPLSEEAFDGHKQRVELKFEKCPHNSLNVISGTELHCRACGAGWVGANIKDLFNLLENQPKKIA